MTFNPRPSGPLAPSPRSPFEPVPARIVDVRRETDSTVTMDFDLSHWPGGFAFAPGQFTMLYRFGIGEVAISISGDPREKRRLTHTIAAVGSVTRPLVALRTGDVLGVRGPYGSAWPVADARGSDLLLVAGGLGLAPLRPALYEVLHDRASYGKVALLYGARTPEQILYASELAAWQKRADLQTLVTVDRATPGWTGNVGVVPDLVHKADFDPTRTVAFVCGPEIMMRFTIRALAARGVGDEQVFLSMERNMKCAIGLCGHCQYQSEFICRDGPVLRCDRVRRLLPMKEI